jgi:glutamate dehydrogenase
MQNKKTTNTKLSKTTGQNDKIGFRKSFLDAINGDDLVYIEPSLLDHVITHQEQLGKNRIAGHCLVEVSNPSDKIADWKNSHTAIHIISDDMVFIVDSITALLSEQSLLIEQIIHPLLFIQRDAKGKVVEVSTERRAGFTGESHIFIQLNRRLTDDQMVALEHDLTAVMEDVHFGTKDWLTIKAKVKAAQNGLRNLRGLLAKDVQEYTDFLDYIHDDNFTLLGYSSYKVTGTGANAKSVLVKNSGLGLLSDARDVPLLNEIDRENFIGNHKAKSGLPPVFVTKLSQKSPVHRRVPLDAITIAQYDARGVLIGEVLVVGLFTSVTYSRSLSTLPLLRLKTLRIFEKTGYEENSHSNRALRHILEKYPRDEMFQIDPDHLYDVCLSILNLQERPRIALYTRVDPFNRNISCLVYIPRDRFDTRLRIKFSLILEEELGATCTNVYSTVDDSPLVRVSFVLAWKAGAPKKINESKIEERLQAEGRSWTERLGEDLVGRGVDEDTAAELSSRYGPAFPAAYQEMYKARQAVHDISKIETVLGDGELALDLYKPYNAASHELSLKLFSPGKPLPLSDILPTLENMGLKVIAEYPFEVCPEGSQTPIWIQDFLMEVHTEQSAVSSKEDVEKIKAQFESCLKGVWAGTIEDDGLNRLVLIANLPWRDVTILRTYVRYLRQTRIPFSLPYMEQAVTDYPQIARLLVDLFHALFNPSRPVTKAKGESDSIVTAIRQNLQNVTALDQDRILRGLTALIEATLRTNFFQADSAGQAKPYLAVKLNSSAVPEIPDPRPFREIFVYSPRVEAIHLRMDRISRGGIRWSDRNEDFRTEVLGLMKAQQVKNSVIVPMGAKGGFIVKQPPKSGGREAFQKEGIECYRTLVRGILDITDNQKGQKIIPPQNVIRRDEDDPYVVVAADKGTATFSDIANALSLEYGFWLGDAFASGGSAGYDHKKMGITARGSWESVKRHFRELNHDTQTSEFDVVGVGDMGGDVFGNGMLQSRKIRLIGAFNHLHIFCDPNPDCESSYKERARLFGEVKGWDHYDLKKLSKGGKIFLRSEKSLQLTPEIQKRFDLSKATVTPAELIHAMLKARTDLLYFGGIGTFIKSTVESHQDAGDRGNDSLRIDSPELRAKVIGEGANLGMTQRARIEYAQKGGRLNTDFIDNSAGVDTSDHEVNIKILLSDIVSRPKSTMDVKSRNKLLSGMTDEIAGLVLRDNYQQTQALSLMELQAAENLSDHASFMTSLEKSGLLNRRVEFLPDDEQIENRRKDGKGLTRPELSLILSYGKITYTNALLKTKLPDDPAMMDWAIRYFPEALQKKYRKEIETHRLHREIIATAISNGIINRLGPTFIRMTMEKTGADTASITNAYMVTRDAFGLRDLWDEVEKQDNKVPAHIQLKALRKIARLAEREIFWFLTRLGRPAHREKDGQLFQKGIQTLRAGLDKILPTAGQTHLTERLKSWKEGGLPDKLARDLALLPLLGMGPDIIKISESLKTDLLMTARVFFALGAKLRFEDLRHKAQGLKAESLWSELAISGLLDQLYSTQSDLTMRILKDIGQSKLGVNSLDLWFEKNSQRVAQVQEMIALLDRKEALDLASLVVMEQSLRRLAYN